jgi:hypothetical protein
MNEVKAPIPPTLPDLKAVTNEEKIAAFDKLFESCTKYAEKVIRKKEYGDDDDPHYLYEETMEAVLGKGIFKVLNEWTKIATAYDRYVKAVNEAAANISKQGEDFSRANSDYNKRRVVQCRICGDPNCPEPNQKH